LKLKVKEDDFYKAYDSPIHIYYSPELDDFRFISQIDFCKYCPHNKLKMSSPKDFYRIDYDFYFIGEL
jgi:hypothetical protein